MIARRQLAVRSARHEPPACLSLADLGLAVTIGIAAKPFNSDFIVTVTDMRIGFGDTVPGIDIGKVKTSRINKYWGFLFAADELGYVRPIADHARDTLAKKRSRKTTAEVTAAVVDAYQAVRSEVIFGKFLKQYGFASMEDFRKRSAKEFGPEVTADLMREMDPFNLTVQLLVYGFDENGTGHFIQIRNSGEALDRDDFDYWAVGAGFNMAMASLTSRMNAAYDAATLVYRCCEAKFVAEYARDVGNATALMIWYSDGTYSIVTEPEIKKLREIYSRTREEKIPQDARTQINNSLEKQQQYRRQPTPSFDDEPDEPTVS